MNTKLYLCVAVLVTHVSVLCAAVSTPLADGGKALQPVIIWWALYCAEVIDWPWRNHSGTDSR